MYMKIKSIYKLEMCPWGRDAPTFPPFVTKCSAGQTDSLMRERLLGISLCYFIVICYQQESLNTKEANDMNRFTVIYCFQQMPFHLPWTVRQTRTNLNGMLGGTHGGIKKEVLTTAFITGTASCSSSFCTSNICTL